MTQHSDVDDVDKLLGVCYGARPPGRLGQPAGGVVWQPAGGRDWARRRNGANC